MARIIEVIGYNHQGQPKLKIQCPGCGRIYVTDAPKKRVLKQRWCYVCRRYDRKCKNAPPTCKTQRPFPKNGSSRCGDS